MLLLAHGINQQRLRSIGRGSLGAIHPAQGERDDYRFSHGVKPRCFMLLVQCLQIPADGRRFPRLGHFSDERDHGLRFGWRCKADLMLVAPIRPNLIIGRAVYRQA